MQRAFSCGAALWIALLLLFSACGYAGETPPASTTSTSTSLSPTTTAQDTTPSAVTSPAATLRPTAPSPVPGGATEGDWLFADGNRIVDRDGDTVRLTGLNWFGYNTGSAAPDGLWNMHLGETVKAIAERGFNVIRVPFSVELIRQWANGEYPAANYSEWINPELTGMNSLQIFDHFLLLSAQSGVKIMIDIHSAKTDPMGHIAPMWYAQDITVDDFYDALEWMAARYAHDDTVIAYDLKNEPHGQPPSQPRAIWSGTPDKNNWKYVAETAAARVLEKNPNALILVEGIEAYPVNPQSDASFYSSNPGDYHITWWGGNLRGMRDYPIDLGDYQSKLVYSPHDYGPSVHMQSWFEGDFTFDSLYEAVWGDNWMFIHEENIAPLLIGEWGGYMTDAKNLRWMTLLRQLILENDLSHTYWCLNSNSGDTGGLLKDDFRAWDEERYDFVKPTLWQRNGKFIGLDAVVPLGKDGLTRTQGMAQ